jgi:hypothetical protein
MVSSGHPFLGLPLMAEVCETGQAQTVQQRFKSAHRVFRVS